LAGIDLNICAIMLYLIYSEIILLNIKYYIIIIYLHNGIKVEKYGYYGNFSQILILNKGCHEPSEERMFEIILNDIPENGTMIELGSYWSFYTMWFNKVVKNAKNYCIEPELDNLNLGKRNCLLNDIKNVDFTQGFIGKTQINLYDFVNKKK